ncbi:HEAT repeat domain-containing protein [Terriglobus sp. RCC_193]|uniref:HEAT repeat domain-containing protein n=1 Tax=Terriglobus sp. RCC_193 TaxID=3239218 RepID=UPI0035238566
MRKIILLSLLALPLAAQQPKIQNGQFSVASTSNLTSEINALKSANTVSWLTYTIPTSRKIQNGWNPDSVAYLESDHDRDRNDQNDNTHESYRALLLLRVADHAVQAIRVEDPERKLDAGGTKVEFLPTVDPTQSIALLQSLAEEAASNKLRDSSIFAISLHNANATVPALVALGSANHDLQVREKAAFWLSTQHGKAALPTLDNWLRDDKDDRFREKLTFDLTLTREPSAADILIRTAHQDTSSKVRKQAQFWMANIAGKRVAGSLSDSAKNDPDESVRKSAVFALSRLPNEEGTPRLIELAQNNKDAAVRKQAVFWLGQSNDPRALEYLTQLVKQ